MNNDTPPCPNATPAPIATTFRDLVGGHQPWVVDAAREMWTVGTGPCDSTDEATAKLAAIIARHAPTAPRPTTDVAGLVERLEEAKKLMALCLVNPKYLAAITDAIAALTQLAPLAGEVEHWKKRAFEAEQKQREMRERELAYAREGHNAVIETANYEHDLRAQIAASELDADALAGALEQISKDAPTWQADTFSAHAIIVCEQALAHRARGAAGGKQE